MDIAVAPMPDITQPQTVQAVERRLEGQAQGGRAQGGAHLPAGKVAANYEEAAKGQPADDRITILGIPVEQITPATQAALGGLVAEIDHLRGVVKRLERSAGRAPASRGAAEGTHVLEPEAFLRALGAALAQPPSPGAAWTLVLVHVPTYEDIRRSFGLLAANGALADAAQRLQDAAPGDAADLPVTFAPVGYAGGANLAALAALPADREPAALASAVRTHLTAAGYVVNGIDMALAVRTAAAAIGTGESAVLALGRADHLLRAAPVA